MLLLAPTSPRERLVRGALAATLCAAIGVAFVALPAHPAALREFPLDDGWIHLVYVRALLTEGIPAYNPGEVEAGFSSPLWLLVAAPATAIARALGASPVLGVKLTSLACGAFAASAISALARRLGASLGASLGALALALLGTGLAEASVSGMEVALAVALNAAACTAAVSDRPWRAGALAALSLLARPESALATIALAAVTFLARRDRVGLTAALRVVLPSALAGGLWCAYNLAVTGHPLPNTFYAKAGHLSLAENLATLARTWTEGGLPRAVLCAVLLALGVARTRSPRDRAMALAVWLAPLAGVLLSRYLASGAGFCVRRYLHAFLPLGFAFAGPGLDALAAALERHVSQRVMAAVLVAVGCLVLAPGCALARRQHAYNSRDITIFHTGLARRVRDELPRTWTIGVEGAGASRYFAERRVVDLLGLNDRYVVHARGTRYAYACALAVRAPDALVVPVELASALSRVFELRPLFGARDDRYTQALPAVAHRVDVYAARVREDQRARCRDRFPPDGRP